MSAKPLYGARVAATVTLNGLANGALADSSEYDNTVDLAQDKLIEVNAFGSNSGESGRLIVYAREGLITGNLETNENLTRIGSVTLNGTMAVMSVLRYVNPAVFFKLVFKHSSSNGYALGATGNTVFILNENTQDI